MYVHKYSKRRSVIMFVNHFQTIFIMYIGPSHLNSVMHYLKERETVCTYSSISNITHRHLKHLITEY
jgi:cation transport regulator ChaC